MSARPHRTTGAFGDVVTHALGAVCLDPRIEHEAARLAAGRATDRAGAAATRTPTVS